MLFRSVSQSRYPNAGSYYARKSLGWSPVLYTESTIFLENPTAPNVTSGDNSTKVANTAFVNAMLGGNAIPAKDFSSNGYVKMANGLIIQWGAVTYNGVYLFPVAFNSIPKLVFGSVNGNNGVPRASNVTTTGFSYGSANNAHCQANYVAIGY